MKLKDKKEIEFWRKAITILERGYGADCKTSDLDDFRKMYTDKKHKLSNMMTHGGRCGSCRAKECVVFLQDHIELIKM